MLNRASFVDPGGRGGNLPRHAGRGPGYATFDVRIARRFRISTTVLELLAESSNVTNRVNRNNPNGNLASPLFGRSPSAQDARQVQLGVRFEF
jgi:hypothetical protein